MGAWGTGIFENDEAMDWLAGWEEAIEGEGTADEPGRIAFVIGALAVVVEHKGYLDIDAGECALAAAEAVAAAGGKPGAGLAGGEEQSLKELAAWAKGPGAKILNQPEVRALAVEAIDRSLAGESELTELWAESADADVWRAGVSDLRTRLGS
ncbi:MAG: DUF4259 domain-containing protein [Phycisphaerales bacterium]|nr:DUF4259 domain-containing protein [Phycisphaerales bacterium]